MVAIDKIGWGKYGEYEGPYTFGSIPYTLPNDPDFIDKCLAVLSATEGKLDAVNMYDGAVISVGMIQWIEIHYHNVSRMLGTIIEQHGAEVVTVPLQPAFDATNSSFRKCDDGLWAFFVGDKEISTSAEQRALFLGCSGRVGSWTSELKQRAKLWASCMSNVWQDKRARDVQVKFTRDRAMGFVAKDAKSILFDDERSVPSFGLPGAVRACYISFAANNSVRALAALKAGIDEAAMHTKWSEKWCVMIIASLVFHSGMKLYEQRYDAVRPRLESLFNKIVLPRTSTELKKCALAAAIVVEPSEQPTPIDAPEEPPRVEAAGKQILTIHEKMNRPSWLDALLSFLRSIFSGDR